MIASGLEFTFPRKESGRGMITATMRYKKGTKVEVLTRELPSGSWWCAEIISGNGHTYNVKYDPSPSGTTELVEKVPRKVIRPCPPVARSHVSWVPGDVVEIFNNGSWKLAEVICAVDRSYCSVRLLGSSGTFSVHRSDVRVRQHWENSRWIVVGKDMGNSDDREVLKKGCLKSKNQKKTKGFLKVQNSEESTAIRDSEWLPSGRKKRGSQYCSSPPETCQKKSKKRKACDVEGIHQQLAAVKTCHFQEKVDAVASPQKMLGEKYMHASLNNRTWLSEVDTEKGRPYADVASLYSGNPESSDASVCSSSGSNDPDMLYHYSFMGPCLDMDSLSDDANSSCWSKFGKKQSVLTKEDLAAKIHELELYAYRTTMRSLYSSGSITWEQEEMMTNLRLELHISNDEHLLELRHLSSSKSDLVSCVDTAPHLL